MGDKKVIGKLAKWWKENDGNAVAVCVAVVSAVSYFYYLVLEPLNSDCFTEGFLKFSNDRHAIGIGKWMISYYAALSDHIIFPLIYIIVYACSVILSALMLVDLWKIKKRALRMLTGALMIVAPATVGQIIYIYLFMAFGLALFFAVLSSYIVCSYKTIGGFVIAVLAMAVSLASYQPYIGVIMFILVGTLILQIISDTENSFIELLKKGIYFIVYGSLGLITYWAIMTVHLKIHSMTAMENYAGIQNASVLNTILNLHNYFKNTYRFYFYYYKDANLYGVLFWGGLIMLAAFGIVVLLIHQIKCHRYWTIPIVLCLLIGIPPSANFIYLVLPEHGMQLHMTYQMQLLAPFCIAIASCVSEQLLLKRLIICSTEIFAIVLVVIYSYCTYASFRTLDIGSRHIKYYVGNALTHAIEDDARTDDMPIVFMGFVDDREVQEWNPLIKYSYFDRAFPFWWDRYEVHSVWPNYCMYYFGVDIGSVTAEQYDNILNSSEFAAMEQYPSSKAYAVIDGCYVILMNRENVAVAE